MSKARIINADGQRFGPVYIRGHHITPPKRRCGEEPQPQYFLDFESAADTAEEIVEYSKTFGFAGDLVFKIEGVAVEVAEIVEVQMPEKSPPPAPGQRELFA